jgi:hypothetical protein
VARTLAIAELGEWLAAKSIAWDEARIERLHDDAITAAGTDAEAVRLIERLFDQLAGRDRPRSSAGPLFRAVVEGTAWDRRRLDLFDEVADHLARLDAAGVPGWLPATAPVGELAFYESYFSNYIEGTVFTVEEAREIVETQQLPAERPEEGHDILGTYNCVVDPVGRRTTAEDPDELISLLTARHETIMAGRPDKRPGRWKTQPNQVGTHQFVVPDLVEGTLRKGLDRLGALPPGIGRALYVMVVISEVHPFVDGNGRVGRVMMNAELSAVDAARIVIPSVYRNEYVSGLRRVSTTGGDATGFMVIMAHAWRWTAAMPWADRAATEGQLEATSALLDSTDAQNAQLRLELP